MRAKSLVAVIVVAGLAALLAGCSTPAPVGTSSTPAPIICSNPEGGSCLGTLEAGTYSTKIFIPDLTYTVPDQWHNWEDTPGNFLLVPPDDTLDGVNAGTSDFWGVYPYRRLHVRVRTTGGHDCGELAKDIADFFTTAEALVSTSPTPVSVGGLSGYSVDVHQADGEGLQCDQWFLAPTFVGLSPSSLTHSTLPGMVVRHYLLDYNGGTLAIKVVDLSGGSRLDAYDEIVKQFVFGV